LSALNFFIKRLLIDWLFSSSSSRRKDTCTVPRCTA